MNNQTYIPSYGYQIKVGKRSYQFVSAAITIEWKRTGDMVNKNN